MAPLAKGRYSGVLALFLGLAVGCGDEVSTTPEAKNPSEQTTAKNDAGKPTKPSTSGKTGSKKPTPIILQPSTVKAADEKTLHQSFVSATRPTELPPPASSQLPPDRTIAGKATPTILRQVKSSWSKIRFTNTDGKRIDYLVTLQTRLGDVEILFYPDVAPNHVRNFLALAKAGYYDGLLFERVGREVLSENQTVNGTAGILERIQGGCPRGTGESGGGHINYWLRPEITKEMTHDEGTVGAWREEEPDSAACRFYITLTKAPFLDGHYTIFGKVTKGLDVVRKIYEQPVIDEPEERDGDYQPVSPVKIDKVVIQELERQ